MYTYKKTKKFLIKNEFTSDGVITLLENANGKVYAKAEFPRFHSTLPLVKMILKNVSSRTFIFPDAERNKPGNKPLTMIKTASILTNVLKAKIGKEIAESPMTKNLSDYMNTIWTLTGTLSEIVYIYIYIYIYILLYLFYMDACR